MRQTFRACCMKAAAMALLLLLLQSDGFAQYGDDTTVVTTITQDDEGEVAAPQEEAAEEEQVPEPEPVEFRSVPDSVTNTLQRDKDFAYANDPRYWVKEKPSDNNTSWLGWLEGLAALRYVFLALLVAALIYAIIKISVSNKLFIFSRSKNKSLSQEEEELLQQENLPELIRQAESQHDYRLAVRYRYMKTLKDLDQRNLVQLSPQSTNWDYVEKLGSHPLRPRFLLLTRAYEYVWYGEFQVNESQYGFIKTEFEQFENSL
jgi:hypothetical protein